MTIILNLERIHIIKILCLEGSCYTPSELAYKRLTFLRRTAKKIQHTFFFLMFAGIRELLLESRLKELRYYIEGKHQEVNQSI